MRSTTLSSTALLVALFGVGSRHVDAAPTPASSSVLVAADAKQPSVAIAPDGTIHVASLRGGNIVVSTSRDRGVTFREPVVALDAGGSAHGGRQRGPRIGSDGKGRLVLTAFVPFDLAERKKRYPAADLYVVTSADAGATWSKPVRVNEVEKKAPESLHALAVAPDGSTFVSWLDLRDRGREKGQDLWFARIEDGHVGKNRKVATDVCECCAPGLVTDGSGNPFLAWREGGDAPSREIFSARSTDGGKTFSKAARVNRTETKEDT